MAISEVQVKHTIRRFIENLPSEGWDCINNKKENYDISAFSQKTDVVKYCLEINNSKIKSVILTEKGSGSESNFVLEVIFSNKPDSVFSLPLEDSNKVVLNDIFLDIKYRHQESLYQDITENLYL